MSLIAVMFSDYATAIRPAIGRDVELGVTQDFTIGNPGVTALFRNYPCSCQSASPRVQSYYAQRDAVVGTEVYFSQPVDVQPNDLLVVTRTKSGNVIYLNVTGTADPVELGTEWVWTVPCEEVSQPT